MVSLSKSMIRAWVYSTFPKPLADVFDDANWSEKRLIGLEGQPHRKTGELKTLVDSFEPERVNVFPAELVAQTQPEEERKTKTEFIQKEFRGKCSVCEFAAVNKFPEGVNRHQHLIPNMVVALPKDKWETAAKAQGKNISEFEGWERKGVQFNCVQLQRFAKKHGIKFLCEMCNSPMKVRDVE